VDTITASASPQPASIPSTRDTYTVLDGHWVGHDEFVVPAAFPEFFARYPRYVSNWVARHMPSTYHSASEREDRSSDLLLHLMELPKDSKYRQPGFNGHPEGCTDRIQVFNPNNAYGASTPRFFNYINLVLRNHFISLKRKAGSNPILRYNNISLYSVDGDSGDQLINEDYLNRMSTSYRDATMNYDKELEQGAMVDEFRAYVEEYNPELLLVLDVIAMCGSYIEAQERLDMTEQIFMRSRNRLKVLHVCFTGSMNPPRQRKVYRARLPKSAPQAAAQFAALAS
jgi:hypothetical protein